MCGVAHYMEVASGQMGGRAEHERVKVAVVNITWPIQDIERDGESKIQRV